MTLLVEGINLSLLVPIGSRSLGLRVGETVVPVIDHPASAAVGDANGNHVPDLTLKLDRARILAAVGGRRGPITATLFAGSRALAAVTFTVAP